MAGITPSQTVGPFLAFSLTPRDYDWPELITGDLLTPDTDGTRIRIEGQMFDGAGAPILGTMLEIWQADAQGRYAHPRDSRALTNSSFKGFGRVETDVEGRFAFDTIRPGAVPGPGGRMQAPHIVVAIHMRGLLTHLYSRIYFSDEAANADDPVLALVPPQRRATLIARREQDRPGHVYRFDLHIQGPHETVFFDV